MIAPKRMNKTSLPALTDSINAAPKCQMKENSRNMQRNHTQSPLKPEHLIGRKFTTKHQSSEAGMLQTGLFSMGYAQTV